MPKITEIFGMNFAKNWTYGAPEICRNRNESTFWQNIGHSKHMTYGSYCKMTKYISSTKYKTSKQVQNIKHCNISSSSFSSLLLLLLLLLVFFSSSLLLYSSSTSSSSWYFFFFFFFFFFL